MKRLLGTMLICLFGLALCTGATNASDCLNLSFGNGDSMCLGLDKTSTSNFRLSIDDDNLGKNSIVTCYVILPNSAIYTLEDCEGNFYYNSTKTQEVTISATYTTKNNYFYSKRVSTYINFSKGDWASNGSSSSSSSSSRNNGDLEVSASPSNPDTYEWVKLTIETDDDYVGRIDFSKFQYRSSSSSSWSNISNRTSSTYVSDYSTYWSNGYYKMTSSDDGYVTLKNLVKFKKSGYYRIYVEDTDGNESYVQINVDTSSSSSSSNGDLEVSASPSNPDTYEWVKLTIETDDDYVGRIDFSKFQYRSSSSASWTTISNRTSSTYVSDYSTYWSNGYYKMTSSDDGYVTLKNLVKFKKSGYYRIYVEDTDGNESYVQINVDTSSSSSSNGDLEVSASPSNPDTYEWVKLTIETDDDYVGRIDFSKFQYRSSSSASWTTISNRTSSTYVSDYSTYWSNGYYKMTSSDDGYVTLKNLVKFKKSGYYRIYVEDTEGNESYVQINVDTSSSSSSSNDDLEVSASPSNPDTYEWVKLTIETDDDYVGRIDFSKFQYRSSSSSSWSNISRTSSTYVSDYSNEWENGYYKMTSSDDGYVTLKNLVKFKKSGYYRIYVEDTDGNESYVQINVDTSSSSSSSNSDEIELSTNRKSPSTSQYVNLTIETNSRYTGKLYLFAKYRSSSSSSWTSISNQASSTYFSDFSDEWEDGYYKMTSSDYGEITLNNLVKFRKSGYYRIYVEDTNGNESYIQFTVGDVDDEKESDVSGFTVSELAKVKSVYREWNSVIGEMKRNYPSLKRDTYWLQISDNFYDDMADVINNKKYRDFQDYEDFEDAFDDWYKYTMRNI